MESPRPALRRLIVNADDFGQSQGINGGIIRCFEHGILTSASLMVRWPYAQAATDYARAHPDLSVGLHIDLGESIYRNGEWVALYTVLPSEDSSAIVVEVEHQLDTFRRLMGRGPTHLDSHQHVHCSPPLDRIVAECGAALGIPVRQRSTVVRYEGSFYGQSGRGDEVADAILVPQLLEILRALPAGTTELGCHPGLGQDAHGMYVGERGQEIHTLCNPLVRATLAAESIQLISFHDVDGHLDAAHAAL